MRQTIRFCTSRDGVRIAFATAGHGPPIVRVNNWFTHLEIDWESPVWRHWLEAFAQRQTLIRQDPEARAFPTGTLQISRSMPGWQTSKR